MKAKLEEVERPLRVPRSMPELELHELQVASLYGEEYRLAYEARVTEVARTLAEELYQDPDFAAAHDGVAQDEALAWLTDLAESMIEEALGTRQLTPEEAYRVANWVAAQSQNPEPQSGAAFAAR